jgi:flagellin
MAIVINSNISSLTAQRALGESQKMQSTAMERLSSGLRINSAKDDAAGLAIAENFTSQINGLNQAVRNANDAYSLAQTAEGGLQETTAILQRMRELAVQASSTTLTSSDRSAIQSEVTALTAEIDRIATTTQYNSANVLDGSAKALSFQVGDSSGQTVGLSISSAKAADIGLSGSGSASGSGITGWVLSGTVDAAVDDIFINGVDWATSLTAGVSIQPDGTSTATAHAMTSAAGVARAINTNTDGHGVVASARTEIVGSVSNGVTLGTTTIAVTNHENTTVTTTIEASSSMDELVSNINSAAAGVTASVNSNGGLTLVSDAGSSIVIGTAGMGGINTGTYHGALSLESVDGTSPITLGVGDNAAATVADVQQLGFNVRTGNTISGGSIEHASNLEKLATDDMTINGVQIAQTRTDKTATTLSASDIAAAINAVSAQSGVTASARTEIKLQMNMKVDSATATSAAANDKLTVAGVTTAALSANDTVATITAAINTAQRSAGSDIVATFSGSVITLVSESGANISVADDAVNNTNLVQGVTRADGAAKDIGTSATTNLTSTAATFGGSLTLTNASGGAIVLGSANASTADTRTDWARFGFSPESAGSSDVSQGVDLSSAVNASAAIAAIDTALDNVNSIRGGLGALQNRLDYTISSLQNTVENHSASRSRVMDADFAVESANLAKSQVLAQASTAMLAQANAAPQLALQLLQ